MTKIATFLINGESPEYGTLHEGDMKVIPDELPEEVALIWEERGVCEITES